MARLVESAKMLENRIGGSGTQAVAAVTTA